MSVATDGTFLERDAGHRLIVTAVVFGPLLRQQIRGDAKQLSAAFELLLPIAIAKEPVITNRLNPSGWTWSRNRRMNSSAGQRHGGDMIAISVVLPAEIEPCYRRWRSDGRWRLRSCGCSARHHRGLVVGRRRGASSGRDPFRPSCWKQVAHESRVVVERLQGIEEGQFAGQERLLQVLQKQPAEEARQHPDRKKPGRQATHRSPPGDRPPPGMTQCRWGW